MTNKFAKTGLPGTEEALDTLANSVLTYATPRIEGGGGTAGDWTDIPAASWGAFKTALAEWTPLYAKCKAAHLPQDTELKNTAKDKLRAAVGDLIAHGLLANPRTAADALAMGFELLDHAHSPKPTPTDHVEFEFALDPESHTVRIAYHIEGRKGSGKGSYHGVEVRFWVRPLDAAAPETAADDGWRSEVDTATPWARTFAASEIGQRLYVAMRWENQSSGKDQAAGKGPWSAIRSVVIS
ncbi:MAG: hypothetical protein LBK00_07525 [Treponema sp.]|jgi:hypothetical protein|nr:hypothetical protein [Treponema sp.]